MPEKQLRPVDYLKSICEPAGTAFQNLRQSVLASGPLDEHVCELIVLGALVTSGNEASFKVHARRLAREQVPIESLRQAVLITLGASTTFSQALAGLHWVDDVFAETDA